MRATLTDPAPGGHPDGGDAAFSLRPNRGRWNAMLERSTAALDAALRASLSADRGSAPLTRRQRAWAGGAALAGLGGVAGLAALAGFRPDLGAYEGAALTASAAAAGLPVALCIRRAVVGSEQRTAEAARGVVPLDRSPPPSPGAPPRGLRRWMGGLRRTDRAMRRRARRQDRAISRALADIALRERRLAASVAAGDAPARPVPTAAVAAPSPAARPAPRALPAARGMSRGAGQGTEQGTEGEPFALPPEVADALADLEARERLQAERVAAARRAHRPAHHPAHHPAHPQAHPPAPHPVPSRPASAAAPKTRRHARIKPRDTRTLIATEDGRKLNATVVDVSQSGVAVEGDLPGLWIGSMVTVGSRRAKAVRVLPGGMAFEFSMPVPAEALTADFVL